jgi:anti-anti-sigma factor
MLDLVPGWQLAVERGPDWLFIRVAQPSRDVEQLPPFAEQIWSLVQQHFTYRVVLELDEIDVLRSHLIGQLVLLRRWIAEHDGVLRLSGLSERCRRVLETCHLDDRFPAYGTRMDAVLCRGACCTVPKPR